MSRVFWPFVGASVVLPAVAVTLTGCGQVSADLPGCGAVTVAGCGQVSTGGDRIGSAIRGARQLWKVSRARDGATGSAPSPASALLFRARYALCRHAEPQVRAPARLGSNIPPQT